MRTLKHLLLLLTAAISIGCAPETISDVSETEGEVLICNFGNTRKFPAGAINHALIETSTYTWYLNGAYSSGPYPLSSNMFRINNINIGYSLIYLERTETSAAGSGSFPYHSRSDYVIQVWNQNFPPAPGASPGCQQYVAATNYAWTWPGGSITHGPGPYRIYQGPVGTNQLVEEAHVDAGGGWIAYQLGTAAY